MKSLVESLFDKDLHKADATTLYSIFGHHIKEFDNVYSFGGGWTYYFNHSNVLGEWNKEHRPELKKFSGPKELQKFIAVILNNTFTSPKQILNMDSDGNFDDEYLNELLKDYGILKADGEANQRRVRVQIGYFKHNSPNSEHISDLGQVGTKRWKGFNTDKIEISIYCYDPKHTGFGNHIWGLLTDITIGDLKKLI